jgi:hypothetical protein
MVQVQPKIATSEHDVDNILCSLRRYYSEIKTKRQLSLDLPAGFCQDNTLQRNYKEFLPPEKISSADPTTVEHHLLSTVSDIIPDDNNTLTHPIVPPASVTNESSIAPVPIL